MRKRLIYLTLICLIIIMGFLSRRILIIPLFIGTVLWATMMFFIMRFVFVNFNTKTIALISLLICYCIELSQLYQSDWIKNVRGTNIGYLILGRGFEFGDIVSYTIGILLGYIFELAILKKVNF